MLVACAAAVEVVVWLGVVVLILVIGFGLYVLEEEFDLFSKRLNPFGRIKRARIKRQWQRKEQQRATSAKSRR